MDVSFWPNRVFFAFHYCEVTRRIEADIKPKDHLGINVDHPSKERSTNRQHRYWIDDEEICRSVIAFDSFKRSGGPGSLKNSAVLFISDLLPVTGFDHIVIIALIYLVMNCTGCEALILEVDFVDRIVDQLCDSRGSLLCLMIIFQFTFLGASTE